MRGRTSMIAAVVVAILASGRLLGRSSQSTPAATPKPASGAETAQNNTREPIIDVHLHAYPSDEAIPDIANPANGGKPGVKTGEEHRQAVLAELKRLNVVRGIVSGGSGDRLAAAIRWREAAPDRIIAGAGIRGSADTPLPPLEIL